MKEKLKLTERDREALFLVSQALISIRFLLRRSGYIKGSEELCLAHDLADALRNTPRVISEGAQGRLGWLIDGEMSRARELLKMGEEVWDG